jgi:hypothetical protein
MNATENTSPAEQPQVPERHRRWPIVIALIFIWPLGLYLLWQSNAFPKKLKKAITAAILTIFVVWAFDGRPLSLAFIFGAPVASWLFWKCKLEERKKRIAIAGVVLLVLAVLVLDARTTGNKQVDSNNKHSKSLAASVMRKTSDFKYVFSCRDDIGADAPVASLNEFVEGLYLGEIALEDGKRFAFRGEAVDANVVQITEAFVIYSVRNYRLEFRGAFWDFAVPRDKKLEGNDSEEDELKEVYANAFDEKRAIVLTGFQQFTTVSGLVKRMPVFETVFIAD